MTATRSFRRVHRPAAMSAALVAMTLLLGVGHAARAADAFTPPALWVDNYGYNAGGWRVDQHPRFVIDVNRDRFADIVGFGDAGVYVSRAVRFQFTFPTLWVDNYGYNAGGWRVERHPRLLGNVNRDSKADIVGFGDAGAYVSLSRATR